MEFTAHYTDHSEILTAKNIILASGSRPMELEAAPIDGERVVDSTGALSFREIPRRLGIIGAGVVGVELASIWSRLGTRVTLLEAQDTLLPIADEKISQEAYKQLKQQTGVRYSSKGSGYFCAVHLKTSDCKLSARRR